MTPTRSSTAIATSALVLICGLLGVTAQQTAPPPPAVPQGRGAEPAGRGGQAPSRDNLAPPAVGTGSISGVVVVEGAGTPVRRARVTLTGPELRGGGPR